MIARHPGRCKSHPFQDKRYGDGRRLLTEGGTKLAPIFRCTVCGGPQKKEGWGKKRSGWTREQLVEVTV